MAEIGLGGLRDGEELPWCEVEEFGEAVQLGQENVAEPVKTRRRARTKSTWSLTHVPQARMNWVGRGPGYGRSVCT